MKQHIMIASPVETANLRGALGLRLEGAPLTTGTANIAMIAELIGRGYKVTVVTLSADIQEPVRIKEGNFDIRYLPLRPKSRDRTRDLWAQETKILCQEMKDVKPDLVHAHWIYEYAQAGCHSGLPLFVSSHDSPYVVLWNMRHFYRVARFIMAARTVFRLKGLSVVSPYLGRHMRAMGYYRNLLFVVPNGLKLSDFPNHQKTLGEDHKIVITTIGDTHRRKNVSSVVKAFAEVRAAFPNAELHLFGADLDAEYTKGYSGVVGHGAVAHEDLIAFHKQHTTVLVHPSKEETFGIAIIEAMAMGIPAIGGYKSGGVPFVFGDSLKDWLVDINKPELIAQKIITLLKDPAFYKEVAILSSQNVVQRFDIRIVVDQLEEIYKEMIPS